MLWIKKHLTALYHLAGALALLGIPLFGSNPTNSEYLNAAVAGCALLLTFVSGNTDDAVGRFAKPLIGALSAGIVAFSSALAGGVTDAERTQIAIAVLVALGAIVAPSQTPQALLPADEVMDDYDAGHADDAPDINAS